jgi:hypothetical protein
MFDFPIEYKGLKPGMKVKIPDGRTGLLINFRLYESGENAPGRATVQFLDLDTGNFTSEGFSISELMAI